MPGPPLAEHHLFSAQVCPLASIAGGVGNLGPGQMRCCHLGPRLPVEAVFLSLRHKAHESLRHKAQRGLVTPRDTQATLGKTGPQIQIPDSKAMAFPVGFLQEVLGPAKGMLGGHQGLAWAQVSEFYLENGHREWGRA